MSDLVTQGIQFFLPYGAGFLTALFIVALIGRAPTIILAPLARLLRQPLRLVRFTGRILRRSPRAAVARSAAVSAKAELDRHGHHMNELDAALRIVDDEPNAEAGVSIQLYEFEAEEALLRREGWPFQSIRVASDDYLPVGLTAKLTEEVANEYFQEASRFFNAEVPLEVNERALYEDAEGAVIVSLFRNSDRRCFYALNEMRKTINGNIRVLMFVFSAILVAALIGMVAASAGRVAADYRQALPIMASVALAAVLAMYLIQSTLYQVHQEHSARELGWFLSRWLDRLNDRFRDATAKAMGVTVGEEKDTDKIAEDARKWHKIMIWTAFRSFFVESYYRNIRFQIDRNRTYYDAVPALVLVLSGIGVGLALLDPNLRPADHIMAAAFAFLVVVVAAVFLRLYYKTVIARELDHSTWLGFENLEVSKAMDEVVGKWGEEIGYWKNRLER